MDQMGKNAKNWNTGKGIKHKKGAKQDKSAKEKKRN